MCVYIKIYVCAVYKSSPQGYPENVTDIKTLDLRGYPEAMSNLNQLYPSGEVHLYSSRFWGFNFTRLA